MESNDSPEIPDSGETSDIPGLLSGCMRQKQSAEETKAESVVTDPDVVDDSLQMFVILKHGGQAGAIPAGLLLKLVVDDGPAYHTQLTQSQSNARLSGYTQLTLVQLLINLMLIQQTWEDILCSENLK